MPEGSYEVVALEEVVGYEQHGVRFAGTVDSVIRFVDTGALVVVDWKTSSGLYPEAAMQVAAYIAAWAAQNDEYPDNIGGWVVRFMKRGRQDPEVKTVNVPEAYRAFARLMISM